MIILYFLQYKTVEIYRIYNSDIERKILEIIRLILFIFQSTGTYSFAATGREERIFA